MAELNPDHPVTKDMHDQWHKFCALLMLKLGKTHVTISMSEVEKLINSDRKNLIVQNGADGDERIHLWLTTWRPRDWFARREVYRTDATQYRVAQVLYTPQAGGSGDVRTQFPRQPNPTDPKGPP
jgi:hypothetical protein